ncbi:recombinase RecT [Burkholderia vietnamiensis]|uniref:recombinase RecT n=1 Tax=Burkholderia vietnamiensis TaxID=60552 RepID=UPI00159496C1|nr:recombinase RecT [Burkholderia vietnamiensis]MCA7943276.1 recombinase RecT [Burkholderia vietnamiensis]HDR8974009.1 recombinase RecT [Burkholderia vietnamiensis]HDR9142389.1 recombinase RecT [Burkholderia vietnamiensis]HDR9166017.1 recombinase RecT [Burkholderia vietnamiensis]
MSTAQLKQVATGKKDNPVASFSSFLDKFKPQMALALPKHLTADRMARLAVTAFSSTPKLQECEPKTIVASIMTAATLGLEIGVDGQGFLVPYGRTCQFVPGWKGLVDLVSRSGRATVWTGAVFDGDEFDYALGDSPFIRHRPGEENDPDKITHVYAVGRVNGSEYPVIEVWTIRKVWKHRDKYNKVGAKHYSFRDPEMYARKVPLLQVLKYMPKSIELQNAMAIANAADNGHHAVIDGNFVTVTDPDTGASVDPSTGELTDRRAQQDDMTLPSYDDLLAKIQKAGDVDALALVLDSARDLPQAEYVKLEQAYQDRREVLLDA